MFNKKNVMVAGGTGLIGTPLVEMLLERGSFVRVVSLDADEQRSDMDRVEWVQADLTKFDECLRATKDMDYVFNLASPKGSSTYAVSRPKFFYVTNILINTHLLECAVINKVDRFLYTSTMHVYPAMDKTHYKEDDATVFNGWGGVPEITNHQYGLWAKRMGELHAESVAKETGWDRIAIVRPTVIYGPQDTFSSESSLLIPTLIRECMANKGPVEILNKKAGRDFLYASDAAYGMICALEKYSVCKPVNLGTGNLYTVKMILDVIGSVLGRQIETLCKSESHDNYKCLDITLAKSLGFEPKVDMDTGIEQTINWYRENICR